MLRSLTLPVPYRLTSLYYSQKISGVVRLTITTKHENASAHLHFLADLAPRCLGDKSFFAGADRADAFARATGLAAFGILRVCPFRYEHLHRSRMGRRARERRQFQSDGARLPAVGARREGRRDEGGHHHGEASRRLLPVAVEHDRVFGQKFEMARRARRRVEGTVGGLQGVRPEVRRLHLALGPQSPAIRNAALQPRLQRSMARDSQSIRRGLRIVARRRERRQEADGL